MICLVRAKAGEAPLDRVVTNLQRYGLWQVDDGRRITAIGGDLCTRQLGLTSEAWLALADHVGDIYHAAADVSWVAAYDAVRSPNVLGTTELILPEDLPEAVLEAELSPGLMLRYHEAVTRAKRQIILDATAQANGNFTEAARLLGVHPNYLQRLIRNLHIKLS